MDDIGVLHYLRRRLVICVVKQILMQPFYIVYQIDSIYAASLCAKRIRASHARFGDPCLVYNLIF